MTSFSIITTRNFEILVCLKNLCLILVHLSKNYTSSWATHTYFNTIWLCNLKIIYQLMTYTRFRRKNVRSILYIIETHSGKKINKM